MNKKIIFNDEAKKQLLEGVNELSKAVEYSLGPAGGCIAIQRKGMSPQITKDGVTIAKSISFKDPVKDMGASLIKDVANKSADEAGDGTTTATVLTKVIVNSGYKAIVAGANPMELRKGMDKAVDFVIFHIKENSIPVEDNFDKIKQIATISANNDESIGIVIADALSKVKKDGILTVEESKEAETYLDFVEGMQFDRGFCSPYFNTNKEKQECILENPLIVFCETGISQFKTLIPALECAKGRPILFIAENVDGEALTGLVVNHQLKGLQVCAVKAPSFGDAKKDILQDLAIITGGVVISREKGLELEDFRPEYFGQAEKVIITKNNTTIVNGKGNSEEIKERVALLKNQIESSTNDYDKEKFKERLAKISGGVAVIYVGAGSETEMKEKKDRVDDALCATRAAIEEGVIPGGSVCYIRASQLLNSIKIENTDQKMGLDIIKEALITPIKVIVENVGKAVNSGVVLDTILKQDFNPNWYDFGYNAKEDKYEGLISAGILDPAKVARVALQNAVSIAGMILVTNCVIFNDDEEDDTISTSPMQM